MFILFSTTIPILIAITISYYFYVKYNQIKVAEKFISYFVIIWFLIFLSQFFILGPLSPIHFYDNADIGLSRILYEKDHHLGGRYLHGILGGQDFYSTQAFGGQIISLEKIIFFTLPLWVSLLTHKFLILAVGFLGSYLLFSKAYKFEKIDSVFASSLITIFNPYVVTSTIQHGLGYSILPLAIFIFLYQTDKKFYFTKVITLSLLISISTLPLHSFQAVIGGLILSNLIKGPKNYNKYFYAIIILLITIILNWHDSFFSMYEIKETGDRFVSGFNYSLILGSIGWLNQKTELCLINCYFQYSPIAILFTIVLILLLFSKNYKAFFILLLMNYVPNISQYLINLINFSSLKSLNFYNYSYYLVIPTCFYLLEFKKESENLIWKQKISIIFVFFSTIYLVNYKFIYLKKIFFESQNQVTKVGNLITREWEPKKFYRMASTNPWDMFHPNFLWSYGIDTIDGYVNIVDINFSKFWHHGLKRKKINTKSNQLYYGGGFFLNFDPEHKNYSIEKKIDLNLLKLVNTGFIASYVPIISEDLKLVSGQIDSDILSTKVKVGKRDLKYYLKQVSHQMKYLKNPKDILIYEIKNYSNRFFFPKKILEINNGLNDFQKFRFISKNYEKNVTFTDKTKLKPAKGEVVKTEKIKNGYNVDLIVKSNGLFVFNSFYGKFWKAYSGNNEIDIINLNDVQMGIIADKDTKKIIFIYERPRLFEKVLEDE